MTADVVPFPDRTDPLVRLGIHPDRFGLLIADALTADESLDTGRMLVLSMRPATWTRRGRNLVVTFQGDRHVVRIPLAVARHLAGSSGR